MHWELMPPNFYEKQNATLLKDFLSMRIEPIDKPSNITPKEVIPAALGGKGEYITHFSKFQQYAHYRYIVQSKEDIKKINIHFITNVLPHLDRKEFLAIYDDNIRIGDVLINNNRNRITNAAIGEYKNKYGSYDVPLLITREKAIDEIIHISNDSKMFLTINLTNLLVTNDIFKQDEFKFKPYKANRTWLELVGMYYSFTGKNLDITPTEATQEGFNFKKYSENIERRISQDISDELIRICSHL